MKLQVEYDLQDMNLFQPGAKYSIHLVPVDIENAKYEIRNTKPAGNWFDWLVKNKEAV